MAGDIGDLILYQRRTLALGLVGSLTLFGPRLNAVREVLKLVVGYLAIKHTRPARGSGWITGNVPDAISVLFQTAGSAVF